MDPITHCALGATCALAAARPGARSAAAVAGVAAGLLPDADILIRSATDPLLATEFHRHFTHAFVFQPVVAALAATLAWLVFRRCLSWRSLFLPALAAAIGHILCDAWTSYGTRLWWPLSDARVAWDLASIIDPLLTLPLVVLAVLALWRRSRLLPSVALAWVALYLGCGWVQHQRAATALRGLAASRGHAVERFAVQPSFANILVWRGLYQNNGSFHAAALRPGFGATTALAGESATAFTPATLGLPPGSRMADDLRRFAHFAGHWLAVAARPGDGTMVIGDARYSLLPQKMAPLWGIAIDPARPDLHARWLSFRQTSPREWGTLWRMVGTPLAAGP